ncbi:surface-adhesin E family protein [Phenylobacterium sp.]|uniref:surface-adhesin E family protein n=1 Tax=Phenylobacterium sp. TaxID=1871053 RepID=UPI00356741BF
MRLRPLLLAAALGLLTASAAQASVYAVISSTPDVVTVVDPRASEMVGGPGVRRTWAVSVKRTLVSGGPQQPGYVRMLNEYDCAQRKIRWRSFDVYSRFGAPVMHKDNDDDSWAPATDGGEGEAGLRVVCDAEAGRSAIAAPSVSHLVIGLMQAWDAAAPLPPLQPVEPIARKKSAHRDKVAARR